MAFLAAAALPLCLRAADSSLSLESETDTSLESLESSLDELLSLSLEVSALRFGAAFLTGSLDFAAAADEEKETLSTSLAQPAAHPRCPSHPRSFCRRSSTTPSPAWAQASWLSRLQLERNRSRTPALLQ